MTAGIGTTDLATVLADPDGRHEAHLDELARYVAIPSASAEDRGAREAAGHICARARTWGLEPTVIETSGQPALVLRGPEVPGAPRVLTCGHDDVQPTGDLTAWRFPPFQASVHDGRIYGRGTGDNKGRVPSIGVPFANADEANHAPNENLELHRFRSAPKISAALLAGLSPMSNR